MKNCLVCDFNSLQKIIDLGMHSFADTFISEDQTHDSEPVYPLTCHLCDNCGHVQLGCETKADARYNLYDYSYTSSNSKFSRNHWDEYAQTVATKLKLQPGAKVVEIGSNDGYLTERFKRSGFEVLGVDPSHQMVEIARSRGITTEACLFTKANSERIVQKFGKVDLIVANNVFNHSDNPLDFSEGVKNLLKDDGYFVYEVPYWYNTIKTQRFDQIYHEHVNYFTVKSSQQLLSAAGLQIVDVDVVDYHGGSLRICAKKRNSTQEPAAVTRMIEEEELVGLFDVATYNVYMKNLIAKRNDFLRKIFSISRENIPIVGVGAAAKANTFLNFYRLDKTVLQYITDASEYKQGKYTPLTRIPIVGDEIFSQYDKVYALILSWNISDILKENLHKINSKIEFLHP